MAFPKGTFCAAGPQKGRRLQRCKGMLLQRVHLAGINVHVNSGVARVTGRGGKGRAGSGLARAGGDRARRRWELGSGLGSQGAAGAESFGFVCMRATSATGMLIQLSHAIPQTPPQQGQGWASLPDPPAFAGTPCSAHLPPALPAGTPPPSTRRVKLLFALDPSPEGEIRN